jgi:hypothetical protein
VALLFLIYWRVYCAVMAPELSPYYVTGINYRDEDDALRQLCCSEWRDAPAGKATFGLATESDEFEFYVLSMAIFSSQMEIFHSLAVFIVI